MRWGTAGKVIVAGHLTQCEDVDPCEPSAARVAEVDPTTFEVRQLVDYKGNDFFKLGTVAIEANDELWIGGIRGQLWDRPIPTLVPHVRICGSPRWETRATRRSGT